MSIGGELEVKYDVIGQNQTISSLLLLLTSVAQDLLITGSHIRDHS